VDRKRTLIKELLAFSQQISKEYPLRRMILFGSQAKGTAGKHSDIDLILVSDKFRGIKRLDRSPPLYLKWNLSYPVDILCYTPEEFERKKKFVGIVQEAIKEGVKLI
jgi:predicted nucleotidyltransferase